MFSKCKEKLPTSAGERSIVQNGQGTWVDTAMADRTLQLGDVLRVHSAYATKYQGKPQLVAQVRTSVRNAD